MKVALDLRSKIVLIAAFAIVEKGGCPLASKTDLMTFIFNDLHQKFPHSERQWWCYFGRTNLADAADETRRSSRCHFRSMCGSDFMVLTISRVAVAT